MRSNEISSRYKCLHSLSERSRASTCSSVVVYAPAGCRYQRGDHCGIVLGVSQKPAPRTLSTEAGCISKQFITVPFDDSLADTYGSIRAFLEKRGTPISHPDLQIAATALMHDLTLVTHNAREFSRDAALRLEDWEAEDK
jgi:hypothetical protein